MAEKIATRAAYGEALVALAEEYPSWWCWTRICPAPP